MENVNFPVMVGVVPLLAVTSFRLTEGYEAVKVAGSPSLYQMVRPSAKTITIEALLVEQWRALRPALEALGLTSRAMAPAAGALMTFAGIPVVTKTVVAADMQITSLVFTQETAMRDTLKVTIELKHVPRSRVLELLSSLADAALAVGSAFI